MSVDHLERVTAADQIASRDDHAEYVTVLVGGQLFGLPIEQVHDVFMPSAITPVPLAEPDIVGLLNLRGRVVTAVSLRQRLGLETRLRGQEMAIGIELDGESFGLIVDGVSEVIALRRDTLDPPPVHLDARWAQLARGVHRLPEGLLVVLDLNSVLDGGPETLAA